MDDVNYKKFRLMMLITIIKMDDVNYKKFRIMMLITKIMFGI